jgi:intraflagellar transport protein 46
MSLSEESDFDDDFDDDIGGKRGDRTEKDDFDFGDDDFENSPDRRRGGSREESKTSTHLVNQPFDEAVDLSDEDSLGTSIDTIDPQNSPKQNVAGSSKEAGPGPLETSTASSKRGDSPPRESRTTAKAEYGDDNDDGMSASSRGGNPKPTRSDSDEESLGEEDDDEDEESDDGLDDSSNSSPSKTKRVKGEYNPSDYAHLNVSAEVKDLWNYIGRYKPHNIELETKLKCFIPDFIPAVGEIDAFIKVPIPGKEEEGEKRLGLKVLDEPASHQSDPTVLDLQLRAISKKSNLEPMVVRSLEMADKNPREIQRWVESINELHRSKPPPQVHYTKTMPDIERLMQVWPEKMEEMLKTVKLPPPAIDLDVRDYARVLCALLDIPVHTKVTESLHVLFTLYSEFSTNQHFMNVDQVATSVPGGTGGTGGTASFETVTNAEIAMFDNITTGGHK